MEQELFICNCKHQIVFSRFASGQDVPVELSTKIKECEQKINDAYMEMHHQQVASIISFFVPLDPLSPIH